MHAHSLSHPIDLDDMDDEATIVSPSPFLAMIAEEAEANAWANAEASGVIPSAHTKLAKGYPSTPVPVQHTFTEPLRGYPEAAAYVPRHEETGVFSTEMGVAATLAMPAVDQGAFPASIATPPVAAPASHSFPATIGMAAVSAADIAPPSYGHNVVPLSPAQPAVEAARPLVVDGGSVSYAPANAPLFAAPAPTPVPPPRKRAETRELRVGRALFGALLGALAGAILWGAVGYLTGGYEFKYGAILIGLFTGVGASRLGGGHSKGVGALGAVFGLAGILTGKVLFEILVQPHLTLGQHIAYHATPIDLVFYAATVVTGFAVGAGTLSPRTIARRGRSVLRRFVPSIG